MLSAPTRELGSPGSDVLILDVGGEKTIKICRSTLTCVAGSKLAEMFSGRWDDSLPKNEMGHFFIDQKPELFLPLRDYLRDLCVMVPGDSNGEQAPPTTPYFKDHNDERAFRRMVDSYDLTNVLYNYEIFEHPRIIYTWNDTWLASRDGSVFSYSMVAGDELRHFSLDRPMSPTVPCHDRKIRSFEVTLQGDFDGSIGWVHKTKVCCKTKVEFDDQARRIAITLDGATNQLGYVNKEKKHRAFY